MATRNAPTPVSGLSPVSPPVAILRASSGDASSSTEAPATSQGTTWVNVSPGVSNSSAPPTAPPTAVIRQSRTSRSR